MMHNKINIDDLSYTSNNTGYKIFYKNRMILCAGIFGKTQNPKNSSFFEKAAENEVKRISVGIMSDTTLRFINVIDEKENQ